MLPGKKYKPEDFLWIAWTRKWFIIIPTVLAAAGTYVWSSKIPNRYLSSTTVLVIPQKVPANYVRSTVTASISQRLRTIQTTILNRTRLERIIEEFKLYPEERKSMIMEDVVELMRRRDIKVQIGGNSRRRPDGASSFTVGFESTQPRQAMLVAERLANMFVQENLEEREVQADSTSQFLQAQLEDARRRLTEHEKKQEEFRQRNFGQLPGQVQSNLQMLQVTQSRIQANSDGASKERDRLHQLEETLADAVANADHPLGGGTVAADTADGANGNALPAGTAAQQLASARSNLAALERRLRPEHPDVVRAKRIIGELETRAAEEASRQTAAPTTDPKGARAPSPAGGGKIATLQTEIEQLQRSLERRKAEDERLKGIISSYTNRIEVAPKLESEYTALMRDYETIRDQYTSLLRKSEDSKLAVNLERRQIAEQFSIVEGARLPERPVSPNRSRLNLMGLFGGFAFGMLVIGLLEYRDTTFKTDDDIVTTLALPVIAVIPAMMTKSDRRRQKRRRVLVTVSASVVLVIGAAVGAWQLGLLASWVR